MPRGTLRRLRTNTSSSGESDQIQSMRAGRVVHAAMGFSHGYVFTIDGRCSNYQCNGHSRTDSDRVGGEEERAGGYTSEFRPNKSAFRTKKLPHTQTPTTYMKHAPTLKQRRTSMHVTTEPKIACSSLSPAAATAVRLPLSQEVSPRTSPVPASAAIITKIICVQKRNKREKKRASPERGVSAV